MMQRLCQFRVSKCSGFIRRVCVQYQGSGRYRIGLLLLILMLTLTSACAVFDKSRPGWDDFVQYNPQPSIQLHVDSVGSGKPVILIHGFAASAFTWRFLVPELAKTHQVFLIDMKGFGESPKPDDGAYSMYDQSRLIINFIQQHKLEDVTLIGHSYGGGVALVTALYLTRNMPGTLSRLVLIDNVAYQQATPFFINILATPLIGKISASTLPVDYQVMDVLQKAYYHDDRITEESIKAYAKPLQTEGGINALLTTARQIFPSDLDQLSQQYPTIKVPTKIIWGEYDEIVPLSVGKMLHEAIASSSLDVILSCGHIPHEECPQQTIPVILQFLR